jgi:ABC-2 type transport system permease protein
MGLFWEFFTFELKFRFKSLSTYVYFLLWLVFSFLCVASESFGPVSNINGKLLLNSAYANAFNQLFAGLFGIIVIAAIFGTSILRDFQRDTYQILFTQPISKFAYLGGRWAGCMVTTVFAFSGLLLGTFLGTFAPWADHTRIGPNHLWNYLQPFFSITVVQIFFIGSVFFAVAALSRKIFIVYLQGVALFMFYVIGITVFSATRSLERFWSGILDPIGLILFDNDVTRYWTVLEKNTQMVTWSPALANGVFLYNRLLWIGAGFAAIGAVWALFPMSVEALTARSQGRKAAKAKQLEAAEALPVRSLVAARLPFIHQAFTSSTTFAQYLSLTRIRLRNIFRDVPFWAIIALLLAFGINNGHFAGRVAERNVWPVTYLMVQAVEGSAILFLFIIGGLYAAELLWRERDTNFSGIHDALPMKESTDFLSRLTAVVVVELILLAAAMLIGIMMQTIAGYYHYELFQYFKELYLVTFPQVLTFVLFAMFIQTVVSNKFLGHGIIIGLFILMPILYAFGWENTLYLVGQVPQYTYSDMNGYGHFVPALFWSITYWMAIAAILAVLSIALARRGAEDSLRARTRTALRLAPRLAPVALLFTVIAIGAGGWYFYNAHILNEYLDSKARRKIQADYELKFKQYENLVQPKVTAVDASVNIYPDRRSFDGNVRMTLQNKSNQSIPQIHLSNLRMSVSHVQFDRPFHLVSAAPRDLYAIYALDPPLAPGETITLTCNVGHQTRGFRDGNELPELAYNGTFFDSDYFPWVGYNRTVELDDPRRRREEKLPALEELAHRGDPAHSLNNIFFSGESDWITYHSIVSTSPDQIAIAPGYLQREWQENGRRYFEYSMGSTHILNFFAYISARYDTKKEIYHSAAITAPGANATGTSVGNDNIALEVYYDPAHTFNIDGMLAGSRDGLDYYQRIYSPYQFKQFRIYEFPRYRVFAQSFPNTIPYSEGIGFIGRVLKPTDVDFTYFVTAHELGHQWWAHQLIGADVEGSNMLSESLAEYSALQLMSHKYGRDLMHRYLRHELDQYLRGRAGEIRHEPPLALVQREPYVWYQKGGQILYTLADYIGEDKLNLALHNFLMQYRYANANNQAQLEDHHSPTAAADSAADSNTTNGPYPDTRMLVDAIRAQTPPELQYLVEDGFDRIVLYDNTALSAKSQKTVDGKYKVTLEVQARKSQADGNGAETRMPLNDYIEIGVFSGKKDEEKPLYLKKEKMTEEHKTFEIMVDEQPTLAGIDPYNKLIDRNGEDNMIDVARQ